MNYIGLYGKSCASNVAKALKYLKRPKDGKVSDFGVVSGSSAKAWEQGFSGDKLGPAWSGNDSLQRVLLVSAQPASLNETHNDPNSPTPQRYATAYMRHVLEVNGLEVIPFALSPTLVPGVHPELQSARDAARLAERTGCQAVVAVGEGPVIDLAKATAMIARCDTSEPEKCFYTVDRATQAEAEPDGIERLCSAGRSLALAVVPTRPSGGIETCVTARLMDWDKEQRMFLLDPIMQPDIVCVDSNLMTKDNEKSGLPGFQDLFVKFALGNLLSICQMVDDLREPETFACLKEEEIFKQIVQAHNLSKEGKIDEAFQTLGNASCRIGDWLHILSQPVCTSKHIRFALTLCDNIPMRYDMASASLLASAADNFWSQQQWRSADRLLSYEKLSRDFLRCDLGLSCQNINLVGSAERKLLDQIALDFDGEKAQKVLEDSI